MSDIPRSTVTTTASPERALLVAVASRAKADTVSTDDSLDELARLAHTAGAEVVGRMIQPLPAPSRNLYIGRGKVAELQSLRETTAYRAVIFDDELSPSQQRNLEDALDVKVIDRAALILDVFARRARSREGQLQVELAQHEYLLPRLAGQWSHLERLGGGIGTRGPGESQLETDRRLIRRRIQHLSRQLERVRNQRTLQRERRRKTGVPVVALVGYTNAGKSTLLNALSQAEVTSKDQLFTTLDPTTRRLRLPPEGRVALMSDTVGFIRKLPPAIIHAFRATLEELTEASLLLHVVDLTSHNAPEQCRTVESILADLDLLDKPRITALNKIDLMLDPAREWDEQAALEHLSEREEDSRTDTVLVSAERNWGLEKLLAVVGETLAQAGAW